MSTRTSPHTIDLGRAVGRFLRAPTERRTYRNLLYLLLMLPLGIAYFALLAVGFSIGVPLLLVGVGVPIILLLLVLLVELAGVERALVRNLLGVDVPTPPAETGQSIPTRTWRFVTDLRTWKAAVYLFSVFVAGNLVVTLIASLLATSVNFLLAPFYYRSAPVTLHAFGPIPAGEFTLDLLFGWDNLLVGLTTTVPLGSWEIGTLPGALLVAALGVLLLLLSFGVSNAFARLWGRYASTMLTAPRYWNGPDW